jgi:hypothetical protein
MPIHVENWRQARQHRKRISEKTAELARLIPGVHKLKTFEMLEEAACHVKLLQRRSACSPSCAPPAQARCIKIGWQSPRARIALQTLNVHLSLCFFGIMMSNLSPCACMQMQMKEEKILSAMAQE